MLIETLNTQIVKNISFEKVKSAPDLLYLSQKINIDHTNSLIPLDKEKIELQQIYGFWSPKFTFFSDFFLNNICFIQFI